MPSWISYSKTNRRLLLTCPYWKPYDFMHYYTNTELLCVLESLPTKSCEVGDGKTWAQLHGSFRIHPAFRQCMAAIIGVFVDQRSRGSWVGVPQLSSSMLGRNCRPVPMDFPWKPSWHRLVKSAAQITTIFTHIILIYNLSGIQTVHNIQVSYSLG